MMRSMSSMSETIASHLGRVGAAHLDAQAQAGEGVQIMETPARISARSASSCCRSWAIWLKAWARSATSGRARLAETGAPRPVRRCGDHHGPERAVEGATRSRRRRASPG